MSLTVFSYATYSTNQTSSAINASGSLGVKLVITTGEMNGSGLDVRLWPCDESGTLAQPMIGHRVAYPDTIVTVVGVQPGVGATAAEPIEGYYVVTIDAALPPFFAITTAREDIVDMTFGIEATLF